MATASHVVKKMIQSRPMLYEAIASNIVNYANLAKSIRPQVEAELGERTSDSAIIMALRRQGEKISGEGKTKIPFKFNSEIIMKTGLADFTFVRSTTIFGKLKKIYDLIDYEKGETLNVIQGNYEITIVINEKHASKVRALLNDEKMLNEEKGLVALAMSFSRDFLYTPGILARVTRTLHWENVNVYENISTMTELIFIVSKKDAVRAYSALEEMANAN